MAGLDFLLGAQGDDQNAARMGLLAAGLGMLANNTGHYGAAGPAIAAGGLQGLQAYQGVKDNALQEEYRKAQLAQLQQTTQKQAALNGFLASRFGGQGTAQVSAPASAPGAPAMTPASLPPQGGAQPRPTASAFPVSLNDVTMLKAMGGPDLFEQYKYANDGIKLEAGNYYKNPITGEVTHYTKVDNGQTVGPNGVVSTAPGYAQSNAQIKGAEAQAVESAKAGFDLVAVPDGKGGTVMMPRVQASQFLRQGYGGAPGASAPGGGFGSTPSAADTEYEAEMAKQSAGQYKTIQDAGSSAGSRINNLQRIGSLLGDFEGGKFTNAQTGMASALNSLGIKVDPRLGNKEAAAALGNEMALKLRDPANGGGMPGAMSDADREFLRSMVPNASQTAEGRKLMIDAGIKIAQRDQQVANFARQWRAKQGRLDKPDVNGLTFADHLQQWSSRNPLFQRQQ
ncbi:conserved hypothetical protein [Cupriavidus taiwanensis]|uniref:hypothetical protein n=1 Tax=Cupriavidus taiwanensis TaxID=164546 RepID=UPI000E1A7B8E|nr:hypothetical protein [Cupriavidus taiwanensis]SPA24585.1 conserved hypothetical protein [Cupriavidus taiwanensis]